jgi:chromosome segregation ATPase
MRAIESVDVLMSSLQKESNSPDANNRTASSSSSEKVSSRSSACVVVPTRSIASFVTTERTSSEDSHSKYSNEAGNAWSQAVDAKLNELIERSKAFERERAEIDSLRSQLKQAIDTAENRLSSNNATSSSRVEELEKQLIDTQQENSKIAKLLFHARTEYQELLAFIESEAVEEGQNQAELKTIAKRVLEKTDARESELSLEVSQLNDQLQFLQSELADAKSQNAGVNFEESDLRIQIEQLRSQLLEARHEAVELRMQSNDLGSRLAKFQGATNSQKSETLSWEQRKEALLQQLEAETHAEVPCDPRKILEIERVIEQTNAEIQRRDQEIADLKTLIEQQSIAHDGMAVGVSAVAEMIESDALIVSERLRLKELREEWEQKQRQAEIEMSMERAKLARERLELQEKTRTFDDNKKDNPPQSEEEKQTGKVGSRGRWLARLGLRDE